MNDRELIQLYKDRNEEALRVTREQYGGYIRSIALRILRDGRDAEETENDVFLRLWQTIPPQNPASFRSYAGMLARQSAVDKFRSINRIKRGGGEAQAALEALECELSSENGEDFADELALRDALERFVKSLRERSRRLFIRRFWYFSSVSEIAEEYGMSEAAVRMDLSRTLRKLRVFLIGEGFAL